MNLTRFIAVGKGLLEAHPDGDLVAYADHAAFVARVREIAEKLKSVNDPDSYERDIADELLALCEVLNGQVD